MKVMNYTEIGSEEVAEEDARRVTVRWLIDENDGAPNFAMRLFEVAPGGYTPRHAHPWEHEVFVVGGRGSVYRDGEYVDVKRGDVVFVPPNEDHQFKNDGDSTLSFLCLIPIV